jgi:hypothetical protein
MELAHARARGVELPSPYSPELRSVKADLAYCHIFDSYADANHSVYAQVA